MGAIEPVDIGGVVVGDGYPVVFMAETSTFFNKDVDLAMSYVKAAVDAGVRIFKSEVLHDPEVCLRDTGLTFAYNHAAGSHTEGWRQIIERKVIPLEGYRRIYDYCRELGVPFVASVYDIEGIDFLVEAGAAAVKIPRDSINNVPLIRYAGRTGLLMIFDAGVAYFYEVARAVKLAQDEGAGGVVVNHHPGANPAPPEAHNMRLMQTYKKALRVPVGLSCHYRGDDMMCLAIGMGANLLEKGVVDDPDRRELDLVSATRLSDLPETLERVSACWNAIGEAPARHKEPRDLSTRKGLAAKRQIAQGEVLGYDNLRFVFPALGISVEHWDQVAGARAARDIGANEVVRWDDVRHEAETPEPATARSAQRA